MRGLFIKDLLANKFVFLGVLLVDLIFIGGMSFAILSDYDNGLTDGNGGAIIIKMFIIFPYITNSMFTSALIQNDEKKLYSSFIISVPSGPLCQVTVKYITLILLNTLGVALSGIVSLIRMNSESFQDISTFRFTVLIASAALILSALEVPFQIRFGTKRGSALRIIFTAIIMIAALLYLLFGDLTIIFGDGDADDRIDRIMNALIDFGENYETKLLVPALITAGAATVVSWFCSLRFYRKGAENFSQ